MDIRKNTTVKEIVNYLRERNITYVKVGITDIDGIIRGKYMHVDKFIKSVKEGFGFCDVIFGWDSSDELYSFPNNKEKPFTGWHTGYPDQLANVVIGTGRNNYFEGNTPLFLAELKDRQVCPRGVLKRVLQRLESINLLARASLEYEFFLFKETSETIRKKKYKNLNNFTPGMFGYSILRSSVHAELYQEILSMCSSMDMDLEGLHTETGPGVIEAAISVDEALKAADKASLFKTFMKILAQRRNLLANFMAKWSDDYPGQSGHIHCSLVHPDGTSAFKGTDNKKTEKMIFFLGGLQKYMREFIVLLAPTINSYKRLCPGAWAPINMTWGLENRTTGFRVIEGTPNSQRIENRLGGADANPYLALAATIGAGLLGIENRINPTQETKGEAYSQKVSKSMKVPSSLKEAVKLFRNSNSARSLFGDEFVDHFSLSREWESNQYLNNSPFIKNPRKVSNWELERYFEII